MGCEVEPLVQGSSPNTTWQPCCSGKGLDQKDVCLPPTSEMLLDISEASTGRFWGPQGPLSLGEELWCQDAQNTIQCPALPENLSPIHYTPQKGSYKSRQTHRVRQDFHGVDNEGSSYGDSRVCTWGEDRCTHKSFRKFSPTPWRMSLVKKQCMLHFVVACSVFIFHSRKWVKEKP